MSVSTDGGADYASPVHFDGATPLGKSNGLGAEKRRLKLQWRTPHQIQEREAGQKNHRGRTSEEHGHCAVSRVGLIRVRE